MPPTDKHPHDGVRLLECLSPLTWVKDQPVYGVDLAAVLLTNTYNL